MFHNLNFKKHFITIALLVMLAAGCSSVSSTLISPGSTSPSFLSPTSIFTITVTPTITLTPTQTITITPKPTITPTLLPSLTPLPTIPINELSLRFEILSATNGGCRLPCFWGMTPGKTKVAELVQFANQISEYSALDFEGGIYTLYYPRYRGSGPTWVVLFFADHEIIQAIDIKMESAQYSFPLSKLLNDYGEPEKVLIGPNDEPGRLSMIVLYENQRIVDRIDLFQSYSDLSLYCYDPQTISQHVVTWAPDEDWLHYINRVFGKWTYVIPKESLKPLNDVSNYDIPSWYQTLKIPNRSLCMKIQTEKMLP